MPASKWFVMVIAVMTLAAITTGSAVLVGGVGAAGARPNPARPLAVTTSDWTTFGQNNLRTGVDPSGNSFSPATQAWQSPGLDGHLYGQPLVFGGRVYVATENDTVYALAADTGATLWSNHLATAVQASALPCGDIAPTVGITSTPVIDPARSEIFVVADEAAPSPQIASHHLIGLNLYTGAVLLDEVIDPPGTQPATQLQRVSLALDRGHVIIGLGGNSGDCGQYHGLVISAPEDGSPPATYVVANFPGDKQGAVWMGGAAPAIDAQGNIWVSTGNSAFFNSTDPYDGSDGVLKLSPSLKLLDYFAPTTWYHDNADDFDLSTAPAILPNGLVFVAGKSWSAYTLNESHLGHVGGQLQTTHDFCSNDPDGGIADLNGLLIVPCSDGLRAVRPTASSPPKAIWKTSSGVNDSAIIAGGLVWSIANGIDGNIGAFDALNPKTGAVVQHFNFCCSASHFPSPSAADGLILVPAGSHIHALMGPAGLPGPPSPAPSSAYDLVASDGGLFAFGGAGFYGSTGSLVLNRPVVGMAATPDGKGYWLVASDGGIFAFGDAGFYGSTGSLILNQPIVGMAATPDGKGYWLVASDGGIFAFGDAGFYGSTGSLILNRPIVGMAATPDGKGYWLVASDGGIFAFGDAGFYGSTGSIHLNKPMVGMAPTPDGRGYWMVASDGGIFNVGDAGFYGSTGAIALNKPVVGMASTSDGGGYWLVASDGGIFSFGDAIFHGSTGAIVLNRPIVGMTATSVAP